MLKEKILFMCKLYKIDYDNNFINYSINYINNNNINYISGELLEKIKNEYLLNR